jgi:queuine tRNA-ribosyltransferase
MNWKGCIITDSGGFQVFSLSQLRKINDEGVEFQSHLDGSRHIFNAEKSIEVQLDLGADIIMSFDECPPYPFEIDKLQVAVSRTAAWAERGKKYWQEAGGLETGCQLFGIMQGGSDEELRRISAEHLVSLDLPGYAIGGVSVGEPQEERYKAFEISAPLLPEDKPRYLMGVGTPEDLLEAIGRGVDMFDCVMPTRNARNGMAFTSRGRLVIRNSKHAEDLGPLDSDCNCYVCANYSRAYLRHMFMSREILGSHLLTYHNIAYYQHLMEGARSAIAEGRYAEWRRSVLSTLQEESEDYSE